jgi:kynurenine formamidase
MFILLSHKIDISTPMYGGKKGFQFEIASSIEKGETANTQKWIIPNHLNTHVDVPYHFFQNGKKLDELPLDFWYIKGEKIQILTVNLSENKILIDPKDIINKNISYDCEFLVFNTGISKYRNQEKFWRYNPGLSEKCAKWIKEKFKKLKIVGIDSISVSSWQYREIGRKVHKILLNPEKSVIIIEDMDLTKVDKDTVFKQIFIAPIIVKESDGSPCTIIAEVENK